MSEADRREFRIRNNEWYRRTHPIRSRDCVCCGNTFAPSKPGQKICGRECKKIREREAQRRYLATLSLIEKEGRRKRNLWKAHLKWERMTINERRKKNARTPEARERHRLEAIEYRMKMTAEQKERLRQAARLRWAAMPLERRRKIMARNRAQSKQWFLKYQREWQKRNPEKTKEYKIRYRQKMTKEQRDQQRERNRQRYKNMDPEKRQRRRDQRLERRRARILPDAGAEARQEVHGRDCRLDRPAGTGPTPE